MADAEWNMGRYISAIFRYSQAEMARRMEEAQVGGQYSYILEVCACPGISQEKLTARLMLNKSSVARAISQLEAQGVLRRETDPADKRIYRLYPTEKGLKLQGEIKERLREINDRITQGMSPGQKEELNVLLSAVRDNICKQRGKPLRGESVAEIME